MKLLYDPFFSRLLMTLAIYFVLIALLLHSIALPSAAYMKPS